jgi:hypothetical protein
MNNTITREAIAHRGKTTLTISDQQNLVQVPRSFLPLYSPLWKDFTEIYHILNRTMNLLHTRFDTFRDVGAQNFPNSQSCQLRFAL